MGGSPMGTLQAIPAQEVAFRKRTVEAILKIVVEPSVPTRLRALTILMLFVLILVSFTLAAFVINLLGAVVHATGAVQPAWYVSLIAAEFVAGLMSAIPLIQRLESFGESKRLEEKLDVVAEKKATRHRTKKVPIQ